MVKFKLILFHLQKFLTDVKSVEWNGNSLWAGTPPEKLEEDKG